MNKLTRTFLFIACFSVTFLSAQKKEITLEEIWSGAFRQEGMQSLTSLNDGKHYVVQEYDRQKQEMRIDKYSYETGEKVATMINSSTIEEIPYFQTFELSADESQAILGTSIESIYRRSVRGIYYVYDLSFDKLTKIDDVKIQEPHFSPQGDQVAYVKDNNIFVKNLTDLSTDQITTDGEKNKMINGLTDWVYEEEFAFVKAYEWSLNGDKIAFLRFDERDVPEFSMDVYGTYGKQLYPHQDTFKYPKAGEDNSEVSLHIADLTSGDIEQVDLGEYEYLPRLKWTKKEDLVSVQSMNRHQDSLKLHFVNTDNLSTENILTKTDDAYVEVNDHLTFLEDNSFIWTSEVSGWRHLYHYNADGSLNDQITEGEWTVTDYYGYDPDRKRVFYQSSENGSVNRGVYSVKLNGRSKRDLATRNGINTADFAADYSKFINTFTNIKTPKVFTLQDAKNGDLIRKIKDNQALKDKLSNYQTAEKVISSIEVNDNELNLWMIKPADFDESKKYPLLMYQYSGPGSQEVKNRFASYNDLWYQMLANQGYIIACVDGRGTGLKGRDFKKVTQEELGKYELEDQRAAAIQLANRSYVDSQRIGIWGWSYGGFMAANAIFQANEVFDMAISVAPVTSWRFYDTIYTERYMTTPQENASGYDENSPITHVDEFEKGDFLLVHGSADDNVHLQNTMQLVEALVQANKQFDWRIYPDKNHGIYGGNTRLHLYRLMTDFIKEQL